MIVRHGRHAAALTLAAAIGLPAIALAQAAPAVPAVCGDIATLDDNLRLETRDPAQAAGSIVIAPGSEPDGLVLRDVRALVGPCGPQVEGMRMGILLLRAGTVGAYTDGARITGVRAFAAEPAPVLAEPSVADAEFIAATRIDGTNVGGRPGENRVGVWRKGDRWLVMAYQASATTATEPKLLLTSAHPVTGLGYFPSPDSPSGGLSLIQSVDGEARILGYRWYHPNVYPHP